MLNLCACHKSETLIFIILRRHCNFFIHSLNYLIMKFKPQYYKTSPLSLVLRLESVSDKLGNVRYCVTMCNGERENVHYLFNHLSSAIDFINSNFC